MLGFVTNSGSTATVVTLQSLLRPGDNILTAENVSFGKNKPTYECLYKYSFFH